jgi:hypothetical protein
VLDVMRVPFVSGIKQNENIAEAKHNTIIRINTPAEEKRSEIFKKEKKKRKKKKKK